MRKVPFLIILVILIWLFYESTRPNRIAKPVTPVVYGPPMPKLTWRQWATNYGETYHLDPNLILAIIRVESSYRVNAVGKVNRNGTRDYGLMGINDSGFAALGLDMQSVLTVGANIDAGCKLLVQKANTLRQHFGKLDMNQLISAYNAGEGTVIQRGIINWPYVLRVNAFRFIYKIGGGPYTRVPTDSGLTEIVGSGPDTGN